MCVHVSRGAQTLLQSPFVPCAPSCLFSLLLYPTFNYVLRQDFAQEDASCLLGVCIVRCASTRVWLLPLFLFHIGFMLVLLTSHFHPSGFSPADRMRLSDVPHGSAQTFALRVSPTWGEATLRWHELVPIVAAAALPTRPRKFLPFSEHLKRQRSTARAANIKFCKSAFSFPTCDVF